MRIQPETLQKWDVGGMQVHGMHGQLKLYQTVRNLTSGDMGIPLVVIRLGVPD